MKTTRWTEEKYQAYLRNRAHGDTPGRAEGGSIVAVRPPSALTLALTLPIPPSVNAMYANAPKGRVLTATAREWKQNAVLLVMLGAKRAGWYYSGERLRLDIVWHFAGLQSDIDGPVKILQDSLAVTLGFNDRVVDRLTVERGAILPDSPQCCITLSFCEVTNEDGCSLCRAGTIT